MQIFAISLLSQRRLQKWNDRMERETLIYSASILYSLFLYDSSLNFLPQPRPLGAYFFIDSPGMMDGWLCRLVRFSLRDSDVVKSALFVLLLVLIRLCRGVRLASEINTVTCEFSQFCNLLQSIANKACTVNVRLYFERTPVSWAVRVRRYFN